MSVGSDNELPVVAGQHHYDFEDNRNIFVERTLALIKPDVIHRYKELEDIILDHGFTILQKRRVQLTPEQVSDLYAEHFGTLYFPSLVAYMSSGPVIALMLACPEAVKAWNHLLGPASVSQARLEMPNCLRARFGTDDQMNALHGSENSEAAQKELRFFFPTAIVEPIAEGQQAKDYLARAVNPTLVKGLAQLCKYKPENPAMWLSDWLLANNPYKAPVKETPGLMIVDDS